MQNRVRPTSRPATPWRTQPGPECEEARACDILVSSGEAMSSEQVAYSVLMTGIAA